MKEASSLRGQQQHQRSCKKKRGGTSQSLHVTAFSPIVHIFWQLVKVSRQPFSQWKKSI